MIHYLATLLILLLCGCSSMKPSAFAEGRPVLHPDRFFHGRTHSAGVVENRDGSPRQQVWTATTGHLVDNVLHIEQDVRFSDGRTQHRSWRLRRIDEHHFTATANDVIGEIHGVAYGNVFHWQFTLATRPGNPLANVKMSQWMYLQPDGETLINHTTVKKAGIVIAQVTEQFRRKRGAR